MASGASVVPPSGGTAQPTSSAPAAAGSPGGTTAAAGPFNFKAILQEMIRNNASDLHLKVGRPPTLRVQGALAPMVHAAMRPEDLKSLAEQVMTPRQVKEFAENKEADFAIGVPGIGRFRVNVYQQRGTIAYALRSIPYQTSTVEELNLPKVINEVAMRPRGLVLVTGITGSGKSTALAAIIQHINEMRRANVITIEDPIEFLHRDINCHINQREVGTDTGSFSQALRRVLRQDPDVILLGEIRDLDTLDTALKAADTGHLGFFDSAHDRRDADHQPRAVVLSAAPAGRGAFLAVERTRGGHLAASGAPQGQAGPGAGVRGADQHGGRPGQHP